MKIAVKTKPKAVETEWKSLNQYRTPIDAQNATFNMKLKPLCIFYLSRLLCYQSDILPLERKEI